MSIEGIGASLESPEHSTGTHCIRPSAQGASVCSPAENRQLPWWFPPPNTLGQCIDDVTRQPTEELQTGHIIEPWTRGRCAEQAGGRSRGGPAEDPPKSDFLKSLRDAVPSGRGGPRQQTKRGILGKPPWAAARLLAREPGTRGRCAEQAGGRSHGGPAEDHTKSDL
jgi:hypothetical protein